MISQCIYLFRDGSEDKNLDKQKNYEVKAKEETAYENVFIHLKTY